MSTFTVYVPAAGGRLAANLEAGTAIVSWPAAPGAERVHCYYQPPSSAGHMVTYADRCHHAAKRLATDAATHMHLTAGAGALAPVGVFDDQTGKVTLQPGAARRLAAWLEAAAVGEDELECRGVADYDQARAWERAARSENSALARYARQHLPRR